MRLLLVLGTVVVLFTNATLSAADPSFIGTWRLSLTKSEFGGPTLVYEALADGQLRSTRNGQSYVFRPDGKEYRTPWGVTSWKPATSNSWTQTSKADGVSFTSSIALSADGKTLTIAGKAANKGAEAISLTEVYRREGSGTGLVGRWTLTKTADTIELSANGSDGLTFRSIEEKGTCQAKFDGKDYPARGPAWPSGSTCSMTRTGPRSLTTNWKIEGRVVGRLALTMSDDGRTLTGSGDGEAFLKNARLVYDRIK